MASAKGSKSITTTKNYRLFKISEENRSLDLKKHRKLKDSMQEYGFLRSFPVVCSRNGDAHLVVKDGQHRLAIAEELGLPVHYVVEEVDFDIAVVNCTPKGWTLRDYACKFAANGKKAYAEGLEFADSHGLPLGVAFALLAGSCGFTNVKPRFIDGTYQIKDRDWAHVVASTYVAMTRLSRTLNNARFLEAVMAVCRIESFEPDRLIHGAEQCRDLLVSYSTRDAYIDLIERLYNFNRRHLVAIKIEAIKAMRSRNPIARKKKSA